MVLMLMDSIFNNLLNAHITKVRSDTHFG